MTSRAHAGNAPTLPKNEACPHCTARFTRTAHLSRHLKTRNTRSQSLVHWYQTCDATFTRGDLLQRHRKICQDPNRHNRLRSCVGCTDSKVKCDRNNPCSRCTTRGKECVYPSGRRAARGSASATPTRAASADSLSAEPFEAPVHSHLSSIYENDVFSPFFSDVFSPLTNSSLLNEPLLSLPSIRTIPRTDHLPEPWLRELLVYPDASAYPKAKLNNYLPSLTVVVEFTANRPVLHVPTCDLIGKPIWLVKSMKSCGALFVKTKKANDFIISAMAEVREQISQALPQSSTDLTDQLHLVTAIGLLQTIGLFHQNPYERAMSTLYHDLAVLTIRRSGLISYNLSWTPATSSTESMWHDWVSYETTKRTLLLSHLHDCCRSIYFGLPTAYAPGEMNLRLPCEDALWRAHSAEEWLAVLQTPISAHSVQSRLQGHDYLTVYGSIMQASPDFVATPNLSSFAHFILIHGILGQLFTICTETTPLVPDDGPNGENPALMTVRYALHHWLQSWRATQPQTQTPTFVENVLPFYWLGHVAILAHQEGLPPFNGAENSREETRYKMVKRWLKHIRSFLAEGGGESTLFWDELMKIQLQTWQLEYETDGGADDQEGLLAFFPEI
ncbi:hypothetical protein FB45DRAFT_893806 [Roridomyces roridus]|uniref:Zn(2)-C6 fungal-type domain-containing protein n=1 Tax=Roridomyces roridus TaxID=1738132 RepID=A0AAD7G0Q6_9AGAR|nr:hypothetical protein FB45DRAFT_893806 [Roridomyces roridus]